MRTTPSFVCLCALSILLTVAINGCVIPGVSQKNQDAGLNGSYEIVESGFPVNWTFSRHSLKNGNMEISLDTTDAVEGKQSLKMIVHSVEYEKRRWEAPWLFRSQLAEPGATYEVSFWMKNQGCIVDLQLKNEGRYVLVDSQFSDAEKQDYADHPPIKRTLGKGQTGTNVWRQFKFIYTVPKTDGSIRLDLGISHPGILWIDDVRIEKVGSP